VQIPTALCAVHNFICHHNPSEADSTVSLVSIDQDDSIYLACKVAVTLRAATWRLAK
ncbi:hypothetical protein PAXRUDRAFT_141365, partial [Paxillus rubicundulus Ve08.2h10]